MSSHPLSLPALVLRRLLHSSAGNPPFELLVGLEVHTQLSLHQKLFSNASVSTRADPNINVSPIDAAFPGTLPRVNPNVLTPAIKSAIILSSSISAKSIFERKHYFYGDLPAGYQITQRSYPFAKGGYFKVNRSDGISTDKVFRIQQIQIEQDSGKSILDSDTLIDLNRAGTAVLEIVTEPDFKSSTEVVTFLKKLYRELCHFRVCPDSMDEGTWRCDVNVSIRSGEKNYPRTEIKHLVKFSSIQDAIEKEFSRQIDILKSGGRVDQETRGYDETSKTTFKLRSKETTEDYRYLVDPDLPPLFTSPKIIEDVIKSMPESLDSRKLRLLSLGLSEYQVAVLMDHPGSVEYFDKVAVNTDPKKAANWIVSELFGLLNTHNKSIHSSPIPAETMSGLISMVESNKVSALRAKDILEITFTTNRLDIFRIAEENSWIQENDETELERVCKSVVESNQETVEKIRLGKDRLIGYLVGETLKRMKSSNPKIVNRIIRELVKGK